MSELDRLVNACLMPAFFGSAPPPWVIDALDADLAGVCLYGHNLTAPGGPQDVPERVREIGLALRAARPDVLVALDEEGGDVTRLEYLVGSGYPGNLALGSVDDTAQTAAVAAAIGRDLRAAGVNVNLAPSVDVNVDPRNPVIGVRSFGADPALVSRHGAAYVRGLQDAGVAATIKHFPGHGATTVDSHLGLPVIDADEATFRRVDLPPFQAGIDAGAALVMTSHVVFAALDAAPATLSRRLLVDLLRTEMGFDGVVITDALDMAGVRDRYGLAGAAVRSLAAGADLLLLGAEDGEPQLAQMHDAVAEHLRAGLLTEERLHEAAGRVAALRARVMAPAALPAAVGHDTIGLEAARRAVRARGVPTLTGPAVVVELRADANMAVGDARWGLADPLGERGLLARYVPVVEGGVTPEDVEVGESGVVIVVRDAYRSAWQRAWVRRALERWPGATLVAFGMPDDAYLTAGPVVLAHGAGRVNAVAVAEVLTP